MPAEIGTTSSDIEIEITSLFTQDFKVLIILSFGKDDLSYNRNVSKDNQRVIYWIVFISPLFDLEPMRFG